MLKGERRKMSHVKREERKSERRRRGIRSHLSGVADPDAIQQSKKLSSLGRLDDLGSRGSLVWLLLPAPHYQLTEENRTGEVLEERERGREGGREERGEGKREEKKEGKRRGERHGKRGGEREGERKGKDRRGRER